MTLADRIADVLDTEPMKLTEIIMAMKRKGWTIPRLVRTPFDLWATFVSILANDSRFERVEPGLWRLRQKGIGA
jgi:hypothetical protein